MEKQLTLAAFFSLEFIALNPAIIEKVRTFEVLTL